MRRLGFLAAYLIPGLTLAGYFIGGWGFALTPLFVFGALPALDWLVGRYPVNAPESTYKRIKDDPFFHWITWLYVPIQWALVVWACSVAASGRLTSWELAGFLISVGLASGGVGITIAHELGHRSNRWEQFLAKTLLTSVSYTHFFIEHNQGHHARVATPGDPASARFGESFFRFYPRTVFGSYFSAWHLETKRLAKKGHRIWSGQNQMLQFAFCILACALSLGWAFGWVAPLFFFAQSVVAFTLLELVNYVEHYGLERRQLGSGRFEKVRPVHSWNASETVTNAFLFNLQRHSDHHAHANRRYQTLRHFDESPQLPTGYAGMILLALLPPLWRRVMDPKVARYQAALAPQSGM